MRIKKSVDSAEALWYKDKARLGYIVQSGV